MELQLNHLTKIYGEKLALDNFTYTFHEGIYGILGANGAGKSTLMHLITDNVSRTSGEILLDGTDVLKSGDDFRAILGFMPQPCKTESLILIVFKRAAWSLTAPLPPKISFVP